MVVQITTPGQGRVTGAVPDQNRVVTADVSARARQPPLEIRMDDAAEGIPALCQNVLGAKRGDDHGMTGELDDRLQVETR